jgi:transketolase
MRVIPNLTVIRPADANETSAAWRYALANKENPVALVLTRQALPHLPGTADLAADGVARGAYVLADAPNGRAQALIIATGSEVQLALAARQRLAEEGIGVRVVSMPSMELFDSQPQEYRDSVLPPDVKARLAVEMAYPLGWERYVGERGAVLGITTFGASAKGEKVVAEYGFTVDNVVAKVKALL